ncbi:hypothetical protein CRE_27521 [Caenorhabditis remanei]|uniref:G-protein coupled receptors family 1 profile domain-containing protein n=1 Tax=Caenorhabditis remanei TaxID=31234 RepID=E3LP28_CAERE|nr:hypothetical protein CRE_27521 [Caenorhabditis remanei]
MLSILITGFFIGLIVEFQVSLIGIFSNLILIRIVLIMKKQENPFYILIIGLAIFDGLLSFLFLIYVTPMTILEMQFMENSYLSAIFGFILMTCFLSATFSHSGITLNRFLAVSFPIIYRNYFSANVTKIIILIFVVTSFLFNSTFSIYDCGLEYDFEYHTLSVKNLDTPICSTYNQICSVNNVFILSAINIFFDVISMMKLRQIIHNRNKNVATTNTAKTDMGYLKQAMAQALYLLFNVCLFFFTFSSFIKNPDYGCIVTSLGWLTLHASDGYLKSVGYNFHLSFTEY